MPRRSLPALAPLAAGVVALAACNAITGVNDLNLPGAGGSGAGESSSSGIEVFPKVAAQGVTISEIAIYQGVKRTLTGGAAPSSGVTVPVVAGRPALLRVFVTVDDTYDGSPVTARLFLGDDKTPVEIVAPVVASAEDNITSTINFDIPSDKMVVGQTYRVELLQEFINSKGDNQNAAFPASGSASLDVASDGMVLKVTIVPIRYGADGSNRLPDTSDEQIEGYRSYFYRMYPVAAMEVKVHEPVQWNQTISPNGLGWDTVLDALAQFRQQDGAPIDEYYFGAFEPAATFNQFCQSGCVAGLGMVGSANDNYSRAAVGIGYTGDMAWTTAIHETGHNHGRNHAPCGGAQGVDPAFPYKNGGIGAWGWDLEKQQLINPGQGKDLMGYCDPYWVSDYTYKAFFDRIKTVNKARIITPEALKDRVWERARVDGQGNLTWLPAVKMALPPDGDPTPVTVQASTGTTTVPGHFIAYDHLPGGVILWQQAANPIAGIQITRAGKTSSLLR